ncbi:MAG: hypothetical protein QOE61_5342 [Micromonosporaceae bacterium]|jgi:IclR family acetate operon transcriptional repressor|nr:hypothetical protein [Micromonosporaceae bacterium]
MTVKSLGSALTTLRALEAIGREQPIGVSALSRTLGITKSSAQRVLATLAEAGWVVDDGSGQARWQLTARALTVGRTYLDRRGFRNRLKPLLTELCAATGETILLSVRDSDQMLIVDGVESEQPVHVSARIGTTHQVVGSAAGHAVCAFLPLEERPLPDSDEFAEIRAQGYALSLGRMNPGVHSVAAPAFDAAGRPYAAVVIAAPAERGGGALFERHGAMLVQRLASLG